MTFSFQRCFNNEKQRNLKTQINVTFGLWWTYINEVFRQKNAGSGVIKSNDSKRRL